MRFHSDYRRARMTDEYEMDLTFDKLSAMLWYNSWIEEE